MTIPPHVVDMLRHSTIGRFSSPIHEPAKDFVSSPGVFSPIPHQELPQVFGLMDSTAIGEDLQRSGLLAHESCMSVPQQGSHLISSKPTNVIENSDTYLTPFIQKFTGGTTCRFPLTIDDEPRF